ncbi:hypothetical protein EVAR_96962_1 [Eumeta japonica]|uniref:Uncharacterized protein n=1 Tax=Eumeta variegata TaxID=151549 RepID=A0A4C1VED3_EUMVA|nr:hypothetical protein EVAR_96962_1 [Eumeta japonica]
MECNAATARTHTLHRASGRARRELRRRDEITLDKLSCATDSVHNYAYLAVDGQVVHRLPRSEARPARVRRAVRRCTTNKSLRPSLRPSQTLRG